MNWQTSEAHSRDRPVLGMVVLTANRSVDAAAYLQELAG
jgi:hypothetical protein